ncbi:MAG: hypothetical protein WC976_01045 [Caldisericia bacterium]
MEDAERSYRRSLETATMVGKTVSEVEARIPNEPELFFENARAFCGIIIT